MDCACVAIDAGRLLERFLIIIIFLFVDTLCIPLNMHVCELSITDRSLSCVFNSSGVYEADRSLEGIKLLSVQLRRSNIQASLRLDTASWADLEPVRIVDYCRNLKVKDGIGVVVSCLKSSSTAIPHRITTSKISLASVTLSQGPSTDNDTPQTYTIFADNTRTTHPRPAGESSQISELVHIISVSILAALVCALILSVVILLVSRKRMKTKPVDMVYMPEPIIFVIIMVFCLRRCLRRRGSSRRGLNVGAEIGSVEEITEFSYPIKND